MPPKPSAAASRSTASGKTFSASQRAASGSMRSVANCRAVSRKACWSSESVKSIARRIISGGPPLSNKRLFLRHESKTSTEWCVVVDGGGRRIAGARGPRWPRPRLRPAARPRRTLHRGRPVRDGGGGAVPGDDRRARAGDAADCQLRRRLVDRLPPLGCDRRWELAAGRRPARRECARRRFLRLHAHRVAPERLLSASPSRGLSRYKTRHGKALFHPWPLPHDPPAPQPPERLVAPPGGRDQTFGRRSDLAGVRAGGDQ